MFNNGQKNVQKDVESTPLLPNSHHRHYHAESTPGRRHGREEKSRRHSHHLENDKGAQKLGTFGGVFVPTTLNVLSILMFLRFGFVLGQAGFLGFIGMLFACYLINTVTTMSISAIASNGTVRGGGAYYLISRSLGPEFGGSIGLVLYMGFVFNTSMNAVGLIDCLVLDFGKTSGNMSNWLPEDYAWRYLWSSAVLVLCTAVCLAGSSLFARCSVALLFLLMLSIFSIPVSTLWMQPFTNPNLHLDYTGLSIKTFKDNLLPQLTKGAAGSLLKGRENFQDLFGILFPATCGIFAGASMSGSLRNPSESIPRGTLYGLVLTFISYFAVITAMAASITRQTLQANVNIIQDVNMSESLILLGELSTSIFSVLMGVIGSATLLQALARDRLLPGLVIFGQGTKKSDEPVVAVLFTYAIAQITMLADVNTIASLATMAFLMTFLVTNLACFLLKISSAPNFRPSFHYFSTSTAALGAILSGATMIFVDSLNALACIVVILFLFITIHYTTTPKSWGDVSQSLIYHQVRKYLLRLRQDHVKFWRPQILLFVNDPRKSYKLIQFCNSLKKGSLFVLGHVIVASDFASAVPEAKKQQGSWLSYIDFSKIKAFVNVVISPGIEWGARNVVLSAGLGGMRPNIVVFGFYNLEEYRASLPAAHQIQRKISRPETPSKRKRRGTIDMRMSGELPTDSNRPERAVSASSYLTILEDLVLQLKVNVAIAYGFTNLELPPSKATLTERLAGLFQRKGSQHSAEDVMSYIDLWPIQMSAAITTQDGEEIKALLTTNFDTYTLILQLGCILHTVPSWKYAYRLRVAVFVEYESDVEEERGRVQQLLSNLRIEAEVLVFWLACGDLKTYEIIVNGNYSGQNAEAAELVDTVLRDDEWWQGVKEFRERGYTSAASVSNPFDGAFGESTSQEARIPSDNMSLNSPSIGGSDAVPKLEKILKSIRKRRSAANLSRLGVSLTMQTHRLAPELLDGQRSEASGSLSDEYEGMSSSSATSDDEDDDGDDHALSTSNEDMSETSSYRQPRTQSSEGNDEFDEENKDIFASLSRNQNLNDARRLVADSSVPDYGDVDRPVSLNGLQIEQALAAEQAELHRSNSSPALVNDGSNDGAIPEERPPFLPVGQEIQLSSRAEGRFGESADPPRRNREASTVTALSVDTNASANSSKSKRPPNFRHQSLPRLSSSLVPRTTVTSEEGPGPTIMFDAPSPPKHGGKTGKGHSIYSRQYARDGSSTPRRSRRSGAEAGEEGSRSSLHRKRSPSTQSHLSEESVHSELSHSTNATGISGFSGISGMTGMSGWSGATSNQGALGFNNLPSRAQHLILNELMRLHSSSPNGVNHGENPESDDARARDRQGQGQGLGVGKASVSESAVAEDDEDDEDNNEDDRNAGAPSGTTSNTRRDRVENAAAQVASSDESQLGGGGAADESGSEQGGKDGNTAVIFTTLQAPPEGTNLSEADSLRYLEDIEALCAGLPPVLMVHSNSVSVTMSL